MSGAKVRSAETAAILLPRGYAVASVDGVRFWLRVYDDKAIETPEERAAFLAASRRGRPPKAERRHG